MTQLARLMNYYLNKSYIVYITMSKNSTVMPTLNRQLTSSLADENEVKVQRTCVRLPKQIRKRNEVKKSRNFCVTSFTPAKYNDWKEMDVHTHNIKYFVFQMEETKEGKQHIQGYIEFINPCKFEHIKRVLGDQTLHIENRQGTADQARAYCMKAESRVKPPIEHGEFKGQGYRSDIKMLYKLLKEGKKPMEIADIMPGTYMKYYKAVDRVYNDLQSDKEGTYTEVDVHVLYGDAGAGKTRYVYDTHGIKNVYRLTQGNGGNVWYDGYHGQDTLLIDDFYGWIKYSTLLQTLDNYKLRLSVKGGHTYSNWKHIYITSNKSPDLWYRQGLTPALARRFKHIKKMTIEKKAVRAPILTTIITHADGKKTIVPGIREVALVLPATSESTEGKTPMRMTLDEKLKYLHDLSLTLAEDRDELSEIMPDRHLQMFMDTDTDTDCKEE